MAHSKSALKRLRQSETLTERNRLNRNVLKKALKTFLKDTAEKPAEAEKALPKIFSAIDKAARKGAIPKGRANRKKARLALLVQRLKKAPAKTTA
jgi:small subunit ribosomal protein S20